MVLKLPVDSSFERLLADQDSSAGQRLLAARDALIEAIGPTTDEFADPAFIYGTILPLLYEKYQAWLSFGDAVGDETARVDRFAASVSNYARRMSKQGLFKRVQPSSYYVTHTYDRFIALGARYSSLPPTSDEVGNGVVAEPPAGLEEDALLGLMSDQVLFVAQDLMVSFQRIASSEIGCPASRDYVASLSESLGALKTRGPRALGPFLQQLLQDETKIHLRNFMYRFEEWFFGAFIDAMREWQLEGIELVELGRFSELSSISQEIMAQYDKGYDYLKLMREVREGLSALLEMDAGWPYKAGWAGYVMRARTLHHDFVNPLMSLQSAGYTIKTMLQGERADGSKKVLDMLMRPFDASKVSTLIDMVIGMTKEDAERAEVTVRKGRIDDVAIPKLYRSSLFRIIHELVRNPIKFHDSSKALRYVKVDAVRSDDRVAVVISDNGVGIADVEEAMRWGSRERPELALGTGVGLANVERLAKENGWRFELESQPGSLTKAKLFMDVAGWDRGDPEEPEDDMRGCAPSDPGLVAAQGSMEAAGMSNIGLGASYPLAGAGMLSLRAL